MREALSNTSQLRKGEKAEVATNLYFLVTIISGPICNHVLHEHYAFEYPHFKKFSCMRGLLYTIPIT